MLIWTRKSGNTAARYITAPILSGISAKLEELRSQMILSEPLRKAADYALK